MWLTTISSMGIHHTRDLHLLGKRAFSGYIPKQIRTVEMEISSWNKGMYIAQLVFDNDLRGDVFFPATTDWLNCFSTDACPIHNGCLSVLQPMLMRFVTDAYPFTKCQLPGNDFSLSFLLCAKGSIHARRRA